MRKYLDFYYECMKDIRIPECGLCLSFPDDELLLLFKPTAKEYGYPYDDYFDTSCWSWGLFGDFTVTSDAFDKDSMDGFEFTELRQTIVLLMAAMNGEL